MTRVTRFGYPARVTVGLVLILLFALTSAAQLLRTALAMPSWKNAVTAYENRAARPQGDDITAYEGRFAKLKSALPRHGAVGYISEPRDSDPRPQVYQYRYLLTQYALSPIIVVDSAELDLVVGNFHSTGAEPGRTASDLTLLQDFGDGVLLFAKTSR